MTGQVDFEKNADYWQQDRWTGQFAVRWHIIKDIPNSKFRHILLENNDNKPVTHSRDSQEVLVLLFISTCICFVPISFLARPFFFCVLWYWDELN